MNSRLLAVIGLVSIALVGLTAEPPERRRAQGGAPLLPRVELLKTLWASQRSMTADYYWLQELQSIGAAFTELQYRDIAAYGQLVTDLDARFYHAYLFAGLNIPYNRGRETWVNVDESTAIFEKGLRAFPGDLRFQLFLAHNLIFFHHQYVRAADVLQQAAKNPGAPSFAAQLATRLLAQSGKFDAGLQLATSLRDSAQTEEERAFYDHRVKQIELERILQDVDRAIAQYRAREGVPPSSVLELVMKGDLLAAPVDPLEGQIVIAEDGRARSTAETHRLELYIDRTNLQ